jgi:hypothetical protein
MLGLGYARIKTGIGWDWDWDKMEYGLGYNGIGICSDKKWDMLG